MKYQYPKLIIKNLIILLLCISMLIPQTVSAATSEDAKTLEKEIEKKYGIEIVLSSEIQKGNSPIYYLKRLDNGLSLMPNGLVKKLVAYYKKKGLKTTVKISLKDLKYGSTAGMYTPETNTIVLYEPKGSGIYFGSGLDEENILHEFGHMLQNALNSLYGSKKLKEEYTKLNGKNKYGKDAYDNSTYVFANWYAGTSYAEDFAETFAQSHCRPDNFRNIYLKNSKAPLIKKAEYINNLINSVFGIKSELMIYPQQPSSKTLKILNEFIESGGMDLTYTLTYAYKIRHHELVDLIDQTLNRAKFNIYLNVLYDEFKYDFDDLENPYSFIKRKDAAKIFAYFLSYAHIDVDDENLLQIKDCEQLSEDYMKDITKVVNAGLMSKTKDGFYPEAYLTYDQTYRAIAKLYELICNQYAKN